MQGFFCFPLLLVRWVCLTDRCRPLKQPDVFAGTFVCCGSMWHEIGLVVKKQARTGEK